eukprot:scaffold1680_cov79-Cylindrotheca_fusiformis.AAC.1
MALAESMQRVADAVEQDTDNAVAAERGVATAERGKTDDKRSCISHHCAEKKRRNAVLMVAVAIAIVIIVVTFISIRKQPTDNRLLVIKRAETTSTDGTVTIADVGDLARMDSTSEELQFPFSKDNTKVIAFKGRLEEDGWSGRSEQGFATLVRAVKGGNRLFTASFTNGDDNCSVFPGSHGLQYISCRKLSEFPEILEPHEPPPTRRNLQFGSNADTPQQSGLTTEIKVFFLWSHDAECRSYGLEPGCVTNASTHSAMEMHADLCIKSFNDAAKISGVKVELKPKYGHRENEYNETEISMNDTLYGGMNDTLNKVRQGNDADLYVMITDHLQGTAPLQPRHCGLGFLNSEPSRSESFFVVDISCSVASLSFAQLVGQNFGCKHDRGTEDDCKSTDDFNYGYRDPQGRYRDIMALPCQPGQCDNLPNETDCTRLPMFSNDLGYLYNKSLPDGGVEQLPVGNWKASCARRMNDVAAAIAGFSEPTTSPSNLPTLSPTLSPYPSAYPTRNPSPYPTIPDPPRIYTSSGDAFRDAELDYQGK